MDYKFKNIKLIDFIKTITIYKGFTLRKLLASLHQKRGYSKSYSGFYNKLKYENLKFSELKDIADELGYEVVLKEKQNL